jgi:hypothetical protein
MGYGIGMFLAGLVSGAAIGWYVALIKVRIAYGNPEDLMRELMLYRGLLYKAGLSVDGNKGEEPGSDPASAELFLLASYLLRFRQVLLITTFWRTNCLILETGRQR